MIDTEQSVAFDQVTVQLGSFRLFDGLSLSISVAQGCAIVGESGSGKSTLLSLVMGMIVPQAGTVRIFGESIDYENLRKLRRNIGFALQETGLFPHLTIRQNIQLPARLAAIDTSETARRQNELCQLMRLNTELLDRFPHELSGGQRQRAGICRAMILRPRLLLLDEPFSGLDVLTRRRIYGDFMKLCERLGTSFVLVTHDLGEAVELCETAVVLRHGRVEQSGTTTQVFRRPESAYVRELVEAQRARL